MQNRQSNPQGSPGAQDREGVNQLLVDTLTQAVADALYQKQSAAAAVQTSGGGRTIKEFDVFGFIYFALEKIWLVVIAAVIGAIAGGIYANSSIPIYSATAKLYMVNSSSMQISISDLQMGSQLTMDYQEVFKTWEVHEMVRDELGLDYSYDDMQKMLSVTNPQDTRVLYITVKNADAQLATRIANAYANAAKTFVTKSMSSEQPSDFSIALVPSIAEELSMRGTILKGFLLASVLMIGILCVIFVLDDRPKTPEDVQAAAGIPTLAVLPVSKRTRVSAQERRREKKYAR